MVKILIRSLLLMLISLAGWAVGSVGSAVTSGSDETATPAPAFAGMTYTSPSACAKEVLDDALDFLDADPAISWRWAAIAKAEGAWGLTSHTDQVVVLDTETLPCDRVFSVVAHEWAHVVIDSDMGLSGSYRVVKGERVAIPTEELVADAVSAKLRAYFATAYPAVAAVPHTPYATQAGGFSPSVLAKADAVLANYGF
jgi:hypothetical protein